MDSSSDCIMKTKKLSIVAGNENNEAEAQKCEDKAQRNLFIFYFFTFLWMWGGNVLFIWQMFSLHAELGTTESNYWVASFFIAVGLDWIIFDPLACLAASVPAFAGFFKWKGYIYDDSVCHYAYKHQKKVL